MIMWASEGFPHQLPSREDRLSSLEEMEIVQVYRLFGFHSCSELKAQTWAASLKQDNNTITLKKTKKKT